MPDSTGVETLSHRRADSRLRQQAYSQGANSYISKPAQISDWLHMVHGLYSYWRTVATLPSL